MYADPFRVASAYSTRNIKQEHLSIRTNRISDKMTALYIYYMITKFKELINLKGIISES